MFLRVHKRIYKRLEQLYGSDTTIYHLTAHTKNVLTGQMDRTFSTTKHKMIALPDKISRDYVQDLAYIAANKNFTLGGYFDKSRKVFLTQKPFSIDLEDIIVYDNKYYEVKETSDYPYLIIITTTRLKDFDSLTNCQDLSNSIQFGQNIVTELIPI